MLSDEEKKAVEILNKWLCKTHSEFCKVGAVGIPNEEFFATEIVLNLIEKQSKEIEELKEDSCCMTNCVRRDKEKLFLEDKIKVKIEEIDKEEKEALKGTKGQNRYAIKREYMYKRSGLQSLLEKE